MEIVRIYCIEDCNGLKYVGSTKRTLKRRLSGHREKINHCMSRELDLENCKIYTLEETDEEHRNIREQYWMDNIDCVNYQNTIFNKKEHYENNKEHFVKYKHQWYEKNKDKINQRNKDNRMFQLTWGGDPRSNNNLLKIDLDIFI